MKKEYFSIKTSVKEAVPLKIKIDLSDNFFKVWILAKRMVILKISDDLTIFDSKTNNALVNTKLIISCNDF